MKNNTVIFGDSYSTFAGFVPAGYEIYYSREDVHITGVVEVEQTWWDMVIREAGLNLILNDSWSGSPIGYTGYDNCDCSATSSFICRLEKYIADGFFEKNPVDKVFVFGGTNDNYADAPLGQMQFENWKKADLYFVLPAICYFLHLLRQTLPKAEIYCLINTALKPEVTACLTEVAQKYGMTPVTFASIEKIDGHPTAKGMEDIKNGVLEALKK